MGPESKNDCAGEAQQQFTGLDWAGYGHAAAKALGKYTRT
jgi:hypothetical protein